MATVRGGKAKRIAQDVTRIAQQNSGIRLRDIPGARNFNIVTMKFAALAVVAILRKIKPRDQKSRFKPGENCLLVKGV